MRTRRSRVALVTAPELPELDEDGPALLAALEERSVQAAAAVWDDPAIDWSGFDLVVVRSVWDAARRREEFLAWSERVAGLTKLVNPVDVLRWNTDKRYLTELELRGIPIVPTRFLVPGDELEVPADGDWVVKPAVSSGSLDTARYTADPDGFARHARRLLGEGRVVMVQPYVAQIDEGGETGLLHFHGVHSHAIEKSAILAGEVELEHGLYATETIGPRQATGPELALATRVLGAIPFRAESLTYARVDLVPGPDGPLLLELELTEPSLFLGHDPAAPGRFADAIVGELG